MLRRIFGQREQLERPPYVPGDEAVFYVVDGRPPIVESQVAVDRFAAALRGRIEPPYRAHAEQEDGDTWTVGAAPVQLVDLTRVTATRLAIAVYARAAGVTELADAAARLPELLAPERTDGLRVEGRIVSALPADGRGPARFEGLYGRLYDRMIRAPRARRAFFSLWGAADPLYDLEGFVAGAVEPVRGDADAVLLDLPCGGGTLLPFLDASGFAGTAVEVDLAARMLDRAAARDTRFRTVFLRADALDLPLRDDVADVAVSVNGLHVVPDPGRFLAELARVLTPQGTLWLITPVTARGVQSRAFLRAARLLGVTPQPPPTLARLTELLAAAGFADVEVLGGASIVGIRAVA